MNDTIIHVHHKESTLLEASDKPGVTVKLDDSSSDEPHAPKVLSSKESKVLDADDKPAQKVEAEASPNT